MRSTIGLCAIHVTLDKYNMVQSSPFTAEVTQHSRMLMWAARAKEGPFDRGTYVCSSGDEIRQLSRLWQHRNSECDSEWEVHLRAPRSERSAREGAWEGTTELCLRVPKSQKSEWAWPVLLTSRIDLIVLQLLPQFFLSNFNTHVYRLPVHTCTHL